MPSSNRARAPFCLNRLARTTVWGVRLSKQAVAAYWRSRGWAVEVRSGGGPDEDVLFMASAPFFVRSGGRLTDLVARLVQSLGGAVVPRPGDDGRREALAEISRRSRRLPVSAGGGGAEEGGGVGQAMGRRR